MYIIKIFLDYLLKLQNNDPPSNMNKQMIINLKIKAKLFLGEIRNFNNLIQKFSVCLKLGKS